MRLHRGPALVCALVLSASSALAGDGAVPPAKSSATAATDTGGFKRIFNTIFSGSKSNRIDAVTFDTSEPPPRTRPTLPPAQAPAPEAKAPVVRYVIMPIPRLRPARPATLAVATVSYETTASIPAESPEPPPSSAASAEPPPSPAVSVEPPPSPAAAVEPPPSTAAPEPPPSSAASVEPPPADLADPAVGDGLLGDVTNYLAPDSGEMAPEALAPDVRDLEMPSAGDAPTSRPDMALPLNAAPFELVRALQSVQDSIAEGVPAAVGAQRALLAEIDRQFAAAPIATWQKRSNAEAAVTYVLSGGAPAILERLSTMEPKPAVDMRLVKGVLAYANGKQDEVWAEIGGFNPLELPASMGAQMALAQSALAVRTDPKQAMRLLSMARLLAPGTLVEEAAIRRQLFVATQLKDNDMVETLARQYLDRFRHSVYAGNFRQRFAAAVSQMDIDSEASFVRIDDMLSPVEAAARCQLYLIIASASIVKGHYTAGHLAAQRAQTFSATGSPEESRARLYDAAALAADPKGFDTASSNLAGVNRTLLRPSDQAFYEVVAVTLDGIRSGTLRDAMPKAGDLPPSEDDPSATAIAKRATAAIQSADDLLKVATR